MKKTQPNQKFGISIYTLSSSTIIIGFKILKSFSNNFHKFFRCTRWFWLSPSNFCRGRKFIPLLL